MYVLRLNIKNSMCTHMAWVFCLVLAREFLWLFLSIVALEFRNLFLPLIHQRSRALTSLSPSLTACGRSFIITKSQKIAVEKCQKLYYTIHTGCVQRRAPCLFRQNPVIQFALEFEIFLSLSLVISNLSAKCRELTPFKNYLALSER